MPVYGKEVLNMVGSSMMQFSTKSWHYKLMTMVHGASYFYRTHYLTGEIIAPKTIRLCPYFWTVVGTTITLPLWAMGGGLIRLVEHIADNTPEFHFPKITLPKLPTPERIKNLTPNDKSLIVRGIYASVMLFFAFLAYKYHDIPAVIIDVAIALVAIIAVPVIKWMMSKHTPKPRQPKAPKEKQPNLWIEMAKAKKSKYCPVIQFIDPSEPEPLQ